MVNDPSEYPAALERFRDKDYLKETSSAVRRNVKKFDINVGAELLYKTILKIHKEHWRAKG